MAAENGHVPSQTMLAKCYFYGGRDSFQHTMTTRERATIETHKLALEWWTKAAHSGCSEAMFKLGLSYQYGDGCEADKKKALDLYKKAYEAGSGDAAAALSRIYEDGQLDEERSEVKARDYLLRGIELGSAMAVNNYAVALTQGQLGMRIDRAKAHTIVRDAVENSVKDEKGHARTSLRIPVKYFHGNVWPIVTLGVCYRDGRDCEVDRDKAIALWRRAIVRLKSSSFLSLSLSRIEISIL